MPEFSLWESLAQHRGHLQDRLDAMAGRVPTVYELFGFASQLGECCHQIFSDLEILTPAERAGQVHDVAERAFDELLGSRDWPVVDGVWEETLKASARKLFADAAQTGWALADRKEAVIRRV